MANASDYYEERQTDLGVNFIRDWESTVETILEDPGIFQKKYKNFRSVRFKRFPFLIIYEVEENVIFIYRVIHGKRSPGKIFKKLL